jgi:hypothetical protein
MTEHRLKQEISWRQIDQEIVAVDLDRGQYLGINESATELWPMLQAGTTSEAMVTRLRERFGISEDRAQADVRDWLEWLADNDLLES